MSIKKHMVGTLGTNVLNIFLGLGYSILSTRLLGPEGKGEFSIFQASIDLFTFFLTFGLHEAVNYYVARKKFEIGKVLSTGILQSFLSSLLFVGIIYASHKMGRVGVFLSEDKDTLFFWMVLLGSFSARMIGGFFSSVLKGYLKFHWINIITITNLVLSLLLYGTMFVLERSGYISVDVGDILVAYLFLRVVNSAFVIYVYAKTVGELPKLALLDKKSIFLMLSWGAISFFATLSQYLNYRIDFWILEYYTNKETLGYYSLATNLSLMLRFVPIAIAPVLLSYIASRPDDEAQKKVNIEQTITLGRIAFFASACIALVGLPLIPWVIKTFYGAEFSETSGYLQWLILGVLPLCLSSVYSGFFFGTGRVKINMYGSLIGVVVTIVMDLLLIPYYGAMGAVTATIASYLSTSLFGIIVFLRIAPVPLRKIILLTKEDINSLKRLWEQIFPPFLHVNPPSMSQIDLPELRNKREIHILNQKFVLPKLDGLLVLQIGLFLYLVMTLLKGSWMGDFWEHAAVIKQFSYSYVETHPILNLDKPHAFYSPYLFFLGFIVKITGLSVIQTLTLAGLVNAALFVYIFPKFVMSVFKNREVAFYSLLFTLFLWLVPYGYSGFFSINILHFVLPYPSTFAIILTFFLFVNHQTSKSNYRYLLTIILTAIIIIVHPLSGIINCFALFAIHLNKEGFRITKNWIFFGISMIIAFLLVFLWPYYSFLELVTGASDVYHSSNKIMYNMVLYKTLPAIFAIPWIVLKGLNSKNDRSLIFLFIALLALFIFGYAFEKWSYGRTISIIVLICHIYLADFYIQVRAWIKVRFKIDKPIHILMVIGLGLFAYRNFTISPFLPIREWHITQHKFEGLSKFLSEDDIVLSTVKGSLPVPAFGPKIIYCHHSQAFIEGYESRKDDMESFLNDTTLNDGERLALIQKYEVNKVLLPTKFQASPNLIQWLQANGTLIFEDENFILYQLK